MASKLNKLMEKAPTEEKHENQEDQIDLSDSISSEQTEVEKHREVCIATAGSVDAGKSSYLGVIAYGELDDGNGLARSKVAKHPHEVSLGKTSDISTRTIRLNPDQELVMVDLCGHEKYLKTTLFGITGYYPDYGILVVAANRGLLKMTREHMGILLYMNIPFIVLITRVDIAPENIYQRTIKSIDKIFKRFKRKVKMINSMDDYSQLMNNEITKEELVERENKATEEAIKCAKMMKQNHQVIPCITVSNKTGYYINVSKKLLENLEPRENVWTTDIDLKNGSLFYIDDKFTPPGIGLVVSGIVKGEPIKVGQKMFIGPYLGKLVPVKVWSLHNNNRENVDQLNNRNRGCIAFRVSDKKLHFGKPEVRKGMIIVSENITKNICYQFKCNIKVLNHSTTISRRYSPVIHCGTVRQTARIILDELQTLKMGDKAEVSFRFVDRPEFMEVGAKFFFREGTTRGVGDVLEVLSIDEDPNPNPAEPKRSKRKRRIRPNKRGRKVVEGKKKIEVL